MRLPASLASVRKFMENKEYEAPEKSLQNSHTIRVKIHPNNTYQVWIDKEMVVIMGDLR